MMEAITCDDAFINDLKQPMNVVEVPEKKEVKKLGKRKRALVDGHYSKEEREFLIATFQKEINSLKAYFNDLLTKKIGLPEKECCLCNSLIASFLEESQLPFSKLVDEIYEKLKNKDLVTLASVRSNVLLVGQRTLYGIPIADSDILEDESESSLWCWETRDTKLLPQIYRSFFIIRRICRKKIHDRISALYAMTSLLSSSRNCENYHNDLKKASDKLGRTPNEAQIKTFVENSLEKNKSEIAEKEAKVKERELIKELERNKRQLEKEKKRMDREVEKEKQQTERELKRMQGESEKEERRREKEEADLKRQFKKQRDEEKRREKEEAELKRQVAIQKQAIIMERFLKSKIQRPDDKNDDSSATNALESCGTILGTSSATSSMDCALCQTEDTSTNDLLKRHLVSWRKNGSSIRQRESQHWGTRHKPKVAQLNELRLLGSSLDANTSVKATAACNGFDNCVTNCESNIEDLVDGFRQTGSDECSKNSIILTSKYNILRQKTKKLLQFHKSYRPAYYGTFSMKSDVVGPRNPLKLDPSLDYSVESDDEWEEEEPGESLSDCDNDDEESLVEENMKTENEDESEDGFLVPDGYLSETEGIQADGSTIHEDDDKEISSTNAEIEKFKDLLRNQRYLCNLTDHALRKNQPVIISNLIHEKDELITANLLSDITKVEQMCLQALCMISCHTNAVIEIQNDSLTFNQDEEAQQSESKKVTTSYTPETILDTHLPEIVNSIQMCSNGRSKVVESLQHKFPSVPTKQIRSKIKEIAVFMDNRWQVKKEILKKLNLEISPENNRKKLKGIASFFSKRGLPPPSETIDPTKSSLQSLKNHSASTEE